MNAGRNYNGPKVLHLKIWMQKDWDRYQYNAASSYSNIRMVQNYLAICWEATFVVISRKDLINYYQESSETKR